MLHKEAFLRYKHKFEKLNRGNTSYGKAPHKPVLLLAVMQQIEKGVITDNRIYLTADLVGAFIDTFTLLVSTGNRPELTLPFYHLTGEHFWHQHTKNGQILRGYVKNITVLNELVDYAYFDEPLFDLLLQPDTRHLLKRALLDTYFPQTQAVYLAAEAQTDAYILNLEKYILNEPRVAYAQDPSVSKDEEQFVRGSLFKKWIPKLYHNTCSISRMRVTSTHGYQLIDACHIQPFSRSNDDTVGNGIALCPNLHRAFDRGIIGVDAHYRVVVSRYITEDETQAYHLKHLAGKELFLPMPKVHLPSLENFVWHLGARFEK